MKCRPNPIQRSRKGPGKVLIVSAVCHGPSCSPLQMCIRRPRPFKVRGQAISSRSLPETSRSPRREIGTRSARDRHEIAARSTCLWAVRLSSALNHTGACACAYRCISSALNPNRRLQCDDLLTLKDRLLVGAPGARGGETPRKGLSVAVLACCRQHAGGVELP